MNKVDRVLLESPFSREPGMRNASTGSGLVEVAVQDPRVSLVLKRNFKEQEEISGKYEFLWEGIQFPGVFPIRDPKIIKKLGDYYFLWRRTHFITALVEVPGQVTVSEKDIASDEEIKENYNKKAPKEKPETPKRNDDVFKFPYEGVMPRKEEPSDPAEIKRIRGEFVKIYAEFLEAGKEISDRIVRGYLRANPWDSNGKTINYMCGAAVKVVAEHPPDLIIYVYWDKNLNAYSAYVNFELSCCKELTIVRKVKVYHQSCIRKRPYDEMWKSYVFYHEGSGELVPRKGLLEQVC